MAVAMPLLLAAVATVPRVRDRPTGLLVTRAVVATTVVGAPSPRGSIMTVEHPAQVDAMPHNFLTVAPVDMAAVPSLPEAGEPYPDAARGGEAAVPAALAFDTTSTPRCMEELSLLHSRFNPRRI